MTVEEALQTLQGDPRNGDAWEVVVLTVYQPLVAYVASLLLSFRIAPETSADDIVHDVLLSFYEIWPKSGAVINTQAALTAYLRTSCRNRLVDKYRRAQHAQQFLDFLSIRYSEAFHDSKPYDSIFLNEIIEKLPEECGSLMREFVTTDMSPAEIADKLGVPPSRFWSRWYRCIGRAKNIFVDIMKTKEGSARL